MDSTDIIMVQCTCTKNNKAVKLLSNKPKNRLLWSLKRRKAYMHITN